MCKKLAPGGANFILQVNCCDKTLLLISVNMYAIMSCMYHKTECDVGKLDYTITSSCFHAD